MKKSQKEMTILIVAIILGAIYCLSISLAYGKYLSIRDVDPLAMLHSLFPIFFVLILFVVSVCIGCLHYDIGNRYIHVVLLIELSLMLWVTPYYLSGFSRYCDNLWHAGVAAQISDTLNSSSPPLPGLYRYGQEYPSSFVFNYKVMRITGIDVFMYSGLIYPSLCSIVFVLLWYVFVSRLFNPKIGFLSTLIAIPGLVDMPEIHVSPHSAGTMLVLTAAILLVTCRSSKGKGLGLFIAFICVLTHPVSPIILTFFIAAPYIIRMFVPGFRRGVSIFGIFGIVCGWFAWVFLNAIITGNEIAESLYKIVSLKFTAELENLTIRATTAAWQMYPEINVLTKIVRYSLIVIALVLFSRVIFGLDFRRGVRELLLQIGKRLGYERLLISSTASLCFVFSFLLVFSGIGITTGMFFERSYFYFVFATAAYIGSEIEGLRPNRSRVWTTYVKPSIFIWFSLVALMYPVIAYAEEAWKGYPPSEGVGMDFVSSHVRLDGKTVSMLPTQQLIAYVNPQTRFKVVRYDTSLSASNFLRSSVKPFPDVIAFRRNQYFKVALSYDLSFEDNRYTKAILRINNSSDFNKIYSSPTFDVYLKN